MAGEEFVQVQLSAAGVKMAGAGGTVQVTEGKFNQSFKPGTAVRVTRAVEWVLILSKKLFQGQPVFEVVTGAAAAVSTSRVAPAVAAAYEDAVTREHPAPVQQTAAPRAIPIAPANAQEKH